MASNATTKPDAANSINIPIDVVLPSNDPAALNVFNEIECGAVSPSTGICTFLAYPGDRKIYVDQLEQAGSWPLSNSIKLKFLRVYYSTASFADATYLLSGTNGFADFELDDAGVPTSDTIEGLENDVQYYFRPGVVDQAFNEAFLSNDAEITGGAQVAGTGCAGNADLNCNLIAVPSEVVGLLTEDVNCFVSTAAYGSSLEKEVRTFRRFRNIHLLQSDFGKKLINIYYEYGPILARFIAKHDYLKPVARAGLYPLAYLAKQSNKHGLHIFIIGLFALGFLFTGFIVGGRKLWQRYR